MSTRAAKRCSLTLCTDRRQTQCENLAVGDHNTEKRGCVKSDIQTNEDQTFHGPATKRTGTEEKQMVLKVEWKKMDKFKGKEE